MAIRRWKLWSVSLFAILCLAGFELTANTHSPSQSAGPVADSTAVPPLPLPASTHPQEAGSCDQENTEAVGTMLPSAGSRGETAESVRCSTKHCRSVSDCKFTCTGSVVCVNNCCGCESIGP
jgi:hypothetical protein